MLSQSQVMNFDIRQHTMAPARVPPAALTTMLQVLTCSHPNAATVFNLLVDLVSSQLKQDVTIFPRQAGWRMTGAFD